MADNPTRLIRTFLLRRPHFIRSPSSLSLFVHRRGTQNKRIGRKKSKGGGENEKKDGENGVTVVQDMHCEGCADKIVKLPKSIDGKLEWRRRRWSGRWTVRGKMLDPLELREVLQEKTKKKVDLVSPQLPKKEKDRDNKSSSASSDNNCGEQSTSMTGDTDASNQGHEVAASDGLEQEGAEVDANRNADNTS
ncbi:heavy metal-associated isoprenylated plant protein 3-like [Rhodamnia argentea]|uniref:Heavy metal-associated isoprenylated plant protein 3-like n=1 Tax=Rhodamnia argentea TaxID=178133 RepID=A0ABM3HCF6_9MYRT|nr:heavy metal-associated isoprenylated plant protein 3-like [Rhodamnia argentea]